MRDLFVWKAVRKALSRQAPMAMARAVLGMLSALGAVAQISNPVLPGDHPDPSVIRVGKTYWTASTSGDWSPQFPLYRSSDLQHWTAAGSVFPRQPTWTTGSFWAPELVYDHGQVLVYYVARQKDGPLCVAVATAPRPEGPFTDHGPMVCQPDGAIDPAFARDEHGKPFLIWKEDANSIRKPTPLWAQPLTPDLQHLTGTKTELMENDPASWEGGVMEAPYVLRHKGMFYLFYAGNGCCGVDCRYAEGVARAPHLLGPYTRDPANPIIVPNENWRCPGHGSAVSKPNGSTYFLYHAYPVNGSIYLGRETVLDQVKWNSDGWPSINAGKGPSGAPAAEPLLTVRDDFRSATLAPEWRWHVNHQVSFRVGGGQLTLTVTEDNSTMLARSLPATESRTAVTLLSGPGALAVAGNARNLFALGRRPGGTALEFWHRTEKGEEVLWKDDTAAQGAQEVRVTSDRGGKQLTFAFRSGETTEWKPAGTPVDVTSLPQWDEGLRIGLLVSGQAGRSATFGAFTLIQDGSR